MPRPTLGPDSATLPHRRPLTPPTGSRAHAAYRGRARPTAPVARRRLADRPAHLLCARKLAAFRASARQWRPAHAGRPRLPPHSHWLLLRQSVRATPEHLPNPEEELCPPELAHQTVLLARPS